MPLEARKQPPVGWKIEENYPVDADPFWLAVRLSDKLTSPPYSRRVMVVDWAWSQTGRETVKAARPATGRRPKPKVDEEGEGLEE